MALGFAEHEFHERVALWLQAQNSAVLMTCSTTELGFIRVLAQAPAYGFTIAQARTLLFRLKQANSPQFEFIADDQDAARLPSWVKMPKQLTDGHLLKLAAANGGVLATLDGRIPGAHVIEES